MNGHKVFSLALVYNEFTGEDSDFMLSCVCGWDCVQADGAMAVEKWLAHAKRIDPLEAMRLPIEQLRFSPRAITCLRREGIYTVRDLTERSLGDLMDIRNFGAKCQEEAMSELGKLGLRLSDTDYVDPQ